MFDDQDQQDNNKNQFSQDENNHNDNDRNNNSLNNEVNQTINSKLSSSGNVFDNEKINSGLSYQDKLKDNKIAEDIFEGADDDSTNQQVVKPKDLNEKSGISPLEPLRNYRDLVSESEDLQNDKIKPLYFAIGLVVILVILVLTGFWVYKQFFTGTRDSGKIILDTDSQEIKLNDNIDRVDKLTPEGINVNSTAISNDLDGDGLSNKEEEALKTDPESTDSDGDGLSDREEVKIYHTDPLDKDTDGDGYVDGEEVENGYDPLGSGRLFDFSLITGDLESDNPTETVIKKLIPPNVDTSNWSSFASNDFNLSFKYPFEWSVAEKGNKIIISPLDTKIKDRIEIEIRKNNLQLDLVDWIGIQEDYPDFKTSQLKINKRLALVVNSENPDWKPLSSIFISQKDLVYNFSFFSDNNSSSNFDAFQALVLSSVFETKSN